MTIYLAAHVASSILVLLVLAWKDHIPSDVVLVFSTGCGSAIALAALSVFRDRQPTLFLPLTAAMAVLALAAFTTLFYIGRKNRWLPGTSAVRGMLLSVRARIAAVLGGEGRRNDDDI
jgi:hypothetical protein